MNIDNQTAIHTGESTTNSSLTLPYSLVFKVLEKADIDKMIHNLIAVIHDNPGIVHSCVISYFVYKVVKQISLVRQSDRDHEILMFDRNCEEAQKCRNHEIFMKKNQIMIDIYFCCFYVKIDVYYDI